MYQFMRTGNLRGSTPQKRFFIALLVVSATAGQCLAGSASDQSPGPKAHAGRPPVSTPQAGTAQLASAEVPGSGSEAKSGDYGAGGADAAHAQLFASTRFPSATQCGECHPTQYRQWSISQHAYAQVSPIFNAFQGKIVKGTNGTNGDFCVRCHTQVGMNLGEEPFMSNIDRNPTSREGISCVICHRVDLPYGKSSGRLAIVEADITQPIYGPTGNNSQLQKAIETVGLQTDPTKTGRKVHGKLSKFFRITTSAFCGTCHDVTLLNGFRLEEAFSEYKHTPASLRGIQCQDCHMGKEPGKVLAERTDPDFFRKNYNFGPAAKVGSFETAPRKLTNHMFVGPDYSVMTPALFPLHLGAVKEESAKSDPKAPGLATMREWIQFDWKAGWGTDDFENKVAADYKFPPRWATEDDRRDGRKIIDDNIKLIAEIARERVKLFRVGYVLGDVKVEKADWDGIQFGVELKNGTDGHNVPTGFDAERLVWLHVVVKDGEGKVIHESGDLDPNGDVRDLNSTYVRNHERPEDEELVSLQGHFLDRLQHGGEREQLLATNYSLGPLPFLRPDLQSDILVGRPQDARKQKLGIAPHQSRWGHYNVTRDELTGKPPYTAHIEFKTAMVPVNIVNDVRTVGFDYGMTASELVHNLLAGHQVIWDRDVVLMK